jgi:hypothetical protein
VLHLPSVRPRHRPASSEAYVGRWPSPQSVRVSPVFSLRAARSSRWPCADVG